VVYGNPKIHGDHQKGAAGAEKKKILEMDAEMW